MKAPLTLLSILCLCLSVSGQATDLDELRKKAEAGDAEAQSNLGIAYYSGNGVPQSFTDAFKWIGEAAKQGYAEAQLRLGYMYATGKGVQQNHATAYALYALSDSSGDASGAGYRDAIAKQMTAAELESGKALYQELLKKNKPEEPEKTEEPEKKEEPEKVEPPAQPQMNLAEKALEELKEKANAGDPEAQFDLGRKYLSGSKEEGVPKDVEEGLKWHLKSAEQGFAPAQFNLGVIYQLGRSVKKDAEKAQPSAPPKARNSLSLKSAIGRSVGGISC